ncbi:hypothetical protein ACWKWC_04315 [Geodermatophilus nigrescens]|uniref:hypothetical protein n=1 Tax=Geodermatophilus sp. FMUSA9-8 TaxID=3120155 RepID=UPI003008F8BF
MTSKRGEPAGLLSAPAVIEQLRQVALHRETARLLDLRASQADTPGAAASLRHRADQRRIQADRLAGSLHRLAAESRHPSAGG